MIGASCQLLLMTINRSADYAKIIHSIPLIPNFETVHFLEILQCCVTSLNELNGSDLIQVEYIDARVGTVTYTDRQWLQDNLLCLITNAIKYSSKSFVRVRVLLSFFPSLDALASAQDYSEEMTGHEMIRFDVEDCGVGVHNIQSIFEAPDFVAHQRKQGGAGIGLYCLSHRIFQLRGEYGVTSSQDVDFHGSTFWFTIPLIVEDLPPTKNSIPFTKAFSSSPLSEKSMTPSIQSISTYCTHSKTSPEKSFYSPFQTKPSASPKDKLTTEQFVTKDAFPRDIKQEETFAQKILVVDDSLPILKMVSTMLQKEGYHVDTAKNGQQAVNIIHTSLEETNRIHYRCILMDLQMPVMDGFHAIRLIREYEAGFTERLKYRKNPTKSTNVPVHHLIVAMSANSDNNTVAAAYEAGCDKFIPKPISLSTFLGILNQE
jgi:CheY-like chemotaxis protein